MRKMLMLAVMGAGIAVFGSENTAKADHCVHGFGSYGVYNGGYAPYGGGFVSGYTFNRAPAFYGYRNVGYSGFYNRPGLSISIGVGRRGFGRGGFHRGGFRRGFRRGGFRRW